MGNPCSCITNQSQNQASPRLLLINPWIYDFAAFDLWMKPVGLLYLAGYLREHGYAVHLIDCLDRYNPDLLKLQGASAPGVRNYGVGNFFRRPIPKPKVLKDIPHPYRRYGIPEEIFVNMLQAVPHPHAILVTSMMTYWYPAVFRTIDLLKRYFPGVPVLLGGVYANLCYHHALAHSQADYVVQERDPGKIIQLIDEVSGYRSQNEFWHSTIFDTYPAYDLYEHLDYACVMTSTGCPFRCTYCASHLLNPCFVQRNPEAVFQEMRYFHTTRNIQNFAFYDDALLVNSSQHLEPLLEQVIADQLPCYFHTPNGLHARYITEHLAELMFQSGFKTLRLSLETADRDRQRHTGGKVTDEEFQQAVETLKRAGFQGKQIGVYLFVGLPGQEIRETEQTIRYVHELGIMANLCEYSPIPGTKAWETLEQQGYVNPEDDPLIHNNSVFLYRKERHTFEQIQHIKGHVRALNRIVKAQEAP